MPDELLLQLPLPAPFSLHMARRDNDTPAPGPAALADAATLIAQARAGDHTAFESLLRCYEARVLRTATRMLGNADDARDAAQEVFLRLHKYLGRFDQARELSPWLYQMTVNVCHDLGKKRRPHLSLEQEAARGALDHLATTDDIEGDLDTARQKQIISAALLTLPEKERAAIVLRDIEGLETSEVARILGSSETTVRSQISMARVKIKRYRDRALGLKGTK
ncbi:MAG: RNA polymerase sigma factor [Blastocatellia bacterium]